MSSTSIRQPLSVLVLGVALPLMITSSCGRPPVEDYEEPSETVTVSGAFADWNPASGIYSNGVFILMDALSNEVFKSAPINTDSPSFNISDVPISGRYYGVLLDKHYTARAYLQKATNESKVMRVFQLSASNGKLGVVVSRENKLEASEQDKLEFISLGISDGNAQATDLDFTTAFSANPDIDADGIPNLLDTDIDGDGIQNIFDPKTYNGSEMLDSNIPWQYNYGYGIPKSGFFKCDHLFARKDSNETIHGSCSLKLPVDKVESVRIETNKTFMDNAKTSDASAAFDWTMRDDGNSGDLIADDGIWTGQFMLSAERWNQVPAQIIIATVNYKSGAVKSYITTLETLKPHENLSIETATLSNDQGSISVVAQLKELSGDSSFQAALTLLDASNDNEIITLTQPLITMSLNFPAENSQSMIEIISAYLRQQPNTPKEVSLKLKLKVSAPAALPGLLGSAFEAYYPTPEGGAPLVYQLSTPDAE